MSNLATIQLSFYCVTLSAILSVSFFHPFVDSLVSIMYLNEILLDAVHNKDHHKTYEVKLRIVRFNKDRAGLFIGCDGQSQYLSCGLSKSIADMYNGKLKINDSFDAEVKVTKPSNNRLYVKVIKIQNIQHGKAPPTEFQMN